MAKHRAPSAPARARLGLGVMLAAGSAAIGFAGSAQAAEGPAQGGPSVAAPELAPALDSATRFGLAPVKDLQLNPFANTSVDPLNNAVGTQVADFKPLSTELLTGDLSRGASLEEVPLAGGLTQVLPG
ncbi:hypothetical protein [Streptomyces sp. KLOTTS4A1]|uniref:hypothetical protein n=1 Tax=Streptomyces sp. KLOTTS4A1 TaxID=3390996 RepID=UPI0039F5F9C8